MKKIALMMTLIMAVAMLTACQSKDTKPKETVSESSTIAETTKAMMEEVTTATESASESVLAELESLLGMDDESAAGLLGGGEENWTEDKSFFIGRIYYTSLAGKSVKVCTTYNQENKVASVSAYITDGSYKVTEDDVQPWVQILKEYAGSEAVYDGTTSEAGSKNWKWRKDDIFITLHWLGDLISFDMQPAIGELH